MQKIKGQKAETHEPSVPIFKTQRIGVWMPLMIGDFRRDTLGMPLEFTAMYINLLTAMWQNQGMLRENEEYLCRVSGATTAQWMRHRQEIASLFVLGPDYWTHNGMRNDLKKANKVSESRRAAATTAVNARWAKERAAKAVTNELMGKITKDGAAY